MLACEGLTKNYGKLRAVDQLSFRIEDGELHGFVGPNGAGKTTTMRILATLLPANAGHIELNGVDVLKRPAKARAMVGYMPDFFGVYDRLKSWEYLDFYARCYGLRAKDRAGAVDRLLALVRLEDKKHDFVDALSRGMKQRLCLARALIHDPKLLVLDEPASGMDPRARAEMKDILRSLRGMGKAVLISSHILPELSEMCDSLTIIDRGKSVFSGKVEALEKRMYGEAPLDIRLRGGVETGVWEKARALIGEFPSAREVTQAEDALRVEMEGGEDVAGALLAKLVKEGLPIVDFHREPVNLEKVFMEVTGQ